MRIQRRTQDIVKIFFKNTKYCEKVTDIHFGNNKKVINIFPLNSENSLTFCSNLSESASCSIFTCLRKLVINIF